MNKSEEKIYELLKSNVLLRDEKGVYTIFPQKLLIKASSKSERTVRGVLKSLEEQGFIRREWLANEHIMLFYFPNEDFSERVIHDRTENNEFFVMKKVSTQIVDFKNDTSNCPHYTEITQADSENCPHSSENCPHCTEITQVGGLTNVSCENGQKRNLEKNSQNEEAAQADSENCSSPEKEIPHIKKTNQMTRYYFPVDKVTSTIFSGKFPIKQEGRLKAESDKDNNKGKKADIIALVDFDELNGVKISRKLTPYDKFVWNTCVNLYVQGGHKIITVEQIYKAMGNSSNPSAEMQAEILDTVETISRARVSIDTTEEHNLYPKYERIKATFQLLPTVTCTAFARGQIVENAIKILETPNLYTFAENRKQIACLPSSILEVPVSKTKDNVTLLDYLIQRISRMKSDKKAPKNILIDTLLVHCGITDKSRKSRLLSKKNGTIKRILDHFAKEKFIQEYNVTDRDIIIII